jgi:hypothetical protein
VAALKIGDIDSTRMRIRVQEQPQSISINVLVRVTRSMGALPGMACPEAMILRRVGIGTPARGDRPRQRRIYIVARSTLSASSAPIGRRTNQR